jgi:hypothetical protein
MRAAGAPVHAETMLPQAPILTEQAQIAPHTLPGPRSIYLGSSHVLQTSKAHNARHRRASPCQTQPTVAAAWQPCASQRRAEPRMLASMPGPSDAPARCLQELANGSAVLILRLHANGAVDKPTAPPASALLTPGAELDCHLPPLLPHTCHARACRAACRVAPARARGPSRRLCAPLLQGAHTHTPLGADLPGSVRTCRALRGPHRGLGGGRRHNVALRAHRRRIRSCAWRRKPIIRITRPTGRLHAIWQHPRRPSMSLGQQGG